MLDYIYYVPNAKEVFPDLYPKDKDGEYKYKCVTLFMGIYNNILKNILKLESSKCVSVDLYRLQFVERIYSDGKGSNYEFIPTSQFGLDYFMNIDDVNQLINDKKITEIVSFSWVNHFLKDREDFKNQCEKNLFFLKSTFEDIYRTNFKVSINQAMFDNEICRLNRRSVMKDIINDLEKLDLESI